MTAILETQKLTKRFGGVLAVDDVTCSVEEHRITAVIGPNGAGKSTLFNLVAGVLPPTTGSVVFQGKTVTSLPAYTRCRLGIARTFQGVELFGNMTVLENVMVGRHGRTRSGIVAGALRLPLHNREEKAIREQAMTALEFMGLTGKADFPALSIPFGQQRLLAIARAMASEPELLMLDEPGAGLNPREKHDLAALICRLRDRGITILLVEHDMELVMGVAETVIVLDFGAKIAEGSPAEIQSDPRVIEAYLGTDEE